MKPFAGEKLDLRFWQKIGICMVPEFHNPYTQGDHRGSKKKNIYIINYYY